MNNNYNTDTHGNKIKLIACIVAAILAFALVAGLVVGLTREAENIELTAAGDNSGAQLSVVNAKGISLLISPIDLGVEDSDFTADPEAESAYSLTATVTPENVKNKAVNWDIEFNNPAAEWAADKAVTDYVKLTKISNNKAVLECMGAFAERIKVTATSDKDATKKAVCMVDYKQKISGLSATLDKITYLPLHGGFMYEDGRRIMEVRVFPDSLEVNTAKYEVTYELSEVYTIKADEPKYYFTFTMNADFISKLNDAGYKTDEMPEVSFGFESQTEGTINNFFDKSWFSSILDGEITAERVNALIDFLITCDTSPVSTFTAYEYEGGNQIMSYDVWLDTTVIEEQEQVENVEMSDSNIMF